MRLFNAATELRREWLDLLVDDVVDDDDLLPLLLVVDAGGGDGGGGWRDAFLLFFVFLDADGVFLGLLFDLIALLGWLP
jgi:hypothetical protein